MQKRKPIVAAKWPNENNFEKLLEPEAKFVFEQAEKHLKETAEVGNLVVTRATTLITLVSGLLIALIGYSFNRWQTIHYFDDLLKICAITIGYLFVIIFMLASNILGKDYSVVGSEPKALLIDMFFSGAVSDAKRLIHFYVSETVQYQGRIEKNKQTNKNRWILYNISLIMVITIPIVAGIIFIIVNQCR